MTSRRVAIRFRPEEIEWLEQWGGIGPTVHRLIRNAMSEAGTLGAQIQQHCDVTGITVTQFARSAGVEPQAVRDIVALRTGKPRDDTRRRIEAALAL